MSKPVNTIVQALTVPDGSKKIMTPAPARLSEDTICKSWQLLGHEFLRSWQKQMKNSPSKSDRSIAAYSVNPEDARREAGAFWNACRRGIFYTLVFLALAGTVYFIQAFISIPHWLLYSLCTVPALSLISVVRSIVEVCKSWCGLTALKISKAWKKWKRKLDAAGIISEVAQVIATKRSLQARQEGLKREKLEAPKQKTDSAVAETEGGTENAKASQPADNNAMEAKKTRPHLPKTENPWTDVDHQNLVNQMDVCLWRLADETKQAMAEGRRFLCKRLYANFKVVFDFCKETELKSDDKTPEFYMGDALTFITELK